MSHGAAFIAFVYVRYILVSRGRYYGSYNYSCEPSDTSHYVEVKKGMSDADVAAVHCEINNVLTTT